MIKRGFTFANVISVIALFVALGGSVYAAGKLNGKTIRVNSVPGNRLKPNSVTGDQINEGSLGAVPNALNAANAASAQPVAFAHVDPDGVLDAANSKNVGAVAREGEGIYCVSGLPFAPKGGVATVDVLGSSDDYAQVSTDAVNVCNLPGAQVFIDTLSSTTHTFADAGFFLVVYG